MRNKTLYILIKVSQEEEGCLWASQAQESICPRALDGQPLDANGEQSSFPMVIYAQRVAVMPKCVSGIASENSLLLDEDLEPLKWNRTGRRPH